MSIRFARNWNRLPAASIPKNGPWSAEKMAWRRWKSPSELLLKCNAFPYKLPRCAANEIRIGTCQTIGPRPCEVLLHRHVNRLVEHGRVLPDNRLPAKAGILFIAQPRHLIGVEAAVDFRLDLGLIERPHPPVLLLLELQDV